MPDLSPLTTRDPETMARATLYTPEYLAREARSMARMHNGGRRVFGVSWEVRVSNRGAVLVVTYHANRPDGCGRYQTEEVL